MEKILLSLAPVAHEGTEIPSGVKNPVTPAEIADEVIACARLGAGMVHLHVRNGRGKQTADLKWFTQTIDLIRAETNIVIQGSTGGVADLSLEQRCVSLTETRVEVASLNMGSANLRDGVYVNTLPDIRYWAKRMQDTGVVPEMEIFDLSMIGSVSRLRDEGLASPPFSFNFCLGFENAIQSVPDHLFALKNALPPNSHWGLIHEDMEDFRLLATAAGMGAKILRVGFEDSFHYRKGRLAPSNQVLVAELFELLHKLDFEPMCPAEARNLLGI